MDKNVYVKFLNKKDELYQITWDLYPHEIEPILKKISDLQWEVERIIYKLDDPPLEKAMEKYTAFIERVFLQPLYHLDERNQKIKDAQGIGPKDVQRNIKHAHSNKC